MGRKNGKRYPAGNLIRFTFSGNGHDSEVADTRHPRNILDPEGGRYAVACYSHGYVVNVDTLDHARYIARNLDLYEEDSWSPTKGDR